MSINNLLECSQAVRRIGWITPEEIGYLKSIMMTFADIFPTLQLQLFVPTGGWIEQSSIYEAQMQKLVV